MGRPARDLTGQTFGRLKVLRSTDSRDNCNVVWKCKCECGTVLNLPGRTLTQGSNVSCGCYRRECGQARTTHGHTINNTMSAEYQSWRAMIARCTDDSHPAFDRYGGRGIKVCKPWYAFDNFIRDMGTRPDGSQLDRIDNDKGYCKTNCRWVSKRKNANNKSNNRVTEYKGKTYTIAQLSRKLGITRYEVKRDFTTRIRG